MRIRVLALSTALAASTLVAAPAMADEPAPGSGSAAAPAAQPFRNSCRPTIASLPPAVQGDPTLKPGAQDPTAVLGLYVWHEKKGWRVRLTHNLPTVDAKPQLIEVRGRITASRPITNVRTVRLEDRQRGEWVSVQRPKRKVMDFRFVNGGYIDGVNFTAGCAGKLTFTAWQVVRDPATKAVTRVPLDVFVGAGRTPVTQTADVANPGLMASPAGAKRVQVLRTPPAS